MHPVGCRDRADQLRGHGTVLGTTGSLGLSATNPSLIRKRCSAAFDMQLCDIVGKPRAWSWPRPSGRIRSPLPIHPVCGMWRCPHRIRRDGWPLDRWSGWAPSAPPALLQVDGLAQSPKIIIGQAHGLGAQAHPARQRPPVHIERTGVAAHDNRSSTWSSVSR
jgi:hypothetical protein